MNDVLYMAWRYVRFYWGKTAVLVASITIILFLPAGLHVVVKQGAETLTSRADATPLLIGAKGSAGDLTLSSLYFRQPNLEAISYREMTRVSATGLAVGIPLHLRYMVGGRCPEAIRERLFRFWFPERPGALACFLADMGANWNISLFRYRTVGSEFGRVLIGLEIPDGDEEKLNHFLDKLGYRFLEETDDPAFRLFL
jgi:hypothetical protein